MPAHLKTPTHALRSVLLAGLVAVTLPLSALAQDATPSNEDLRALRFYIEQNQTAAVTAEVSRLQKAFPGWTPPSDLKQLLVTGPTTEIANIYARLSRNDITGAQALIAQTKEKYPSWTVPSDLQAQIKLTQAQKSFDAAVAGRDVASALELVSDTPALLRCDRINNTWNLALLQEQAGNKSGAYLTYQQIVATCNGIPDLVATIEKSDAVTTPQQLEGLVDAAKARFVTQSATFDALEQRLLAGRGLTQGTTTSATKTTTPAPRSTTTSAAPRTAPVARAPSTPRPAPVQTSLPRSGDNRLSRTRADAKTGSWAACAADSANPRSLDIAYERAWCVYNLDRPLEALSYFSMAAQGGLGSTVARDARFGMALALLKREMTDDASRVAASSDFTMDQRREIEGQILNQRGVRAYNTRQYAKSVQYFDALQKLKGGAITRDLALMRGYAMLNMGKREEARTEFERLNNELSTAETRAALAATY
ncbi:hypothetical protein KM176_14205 [Pseudooceanicola sp. CBS1P-1]|uniref:Tetratricopeptide repeat protein n=1 Tax=Pseudooceanicola albus TaxID=2692189 RepID=A0A6L7G3H3_9RHOB|nr:MULTISPECIES: hypothetical protein [Pseudooceanicola]MBT9385020.1 hypothetical protein [Pseudooceanicola endophyticus]MXN17986.1 hypothetical protein [Pseudooceanicola albus]